MRPADFKTILAENGGLSVFRFSVGQPRVLAVSSKSFHIRE